MGRPPTRPSKLRDGYYIEVRTKGNEKGIKLRSDTLEEMEMSARKYQKTKEVVILGKYENGQPVKT